MNSKGKSFALVLVALGAACASLRSGGRPRPASAAPSSTAPPGFAGKPGTGFIFAFDPEKCRSSVRGVWEGSPAEVMDVEYGDVVIEYAGVDFASIGCNEAEAGTRQREARERIRAMKIGDVVSVVLERRGRRIPLDLRLEDLAVLYERAERIEADMATASPRPSPAVVGTSGR